MIIEHDLDCTAIYRHERRQLLAFVRSLTPPQLETMVPATPEWRVLDVLAHLVGITADLNALRFGDGSDGRRRVDGGPGRLEARSIDRRARSASGNTKSTMFDGGLTALGYPIGSHYVGDLLQHVVDVRSAVGAGRYEPDDALTAGLDFYVDVLASRR